MTKIDQNYIPPVIDPENYSKGDEGALQKQGKLKTPAGLPLNAANMTTEDLENLLKTTSEQMITSMGLLGMDRILTPEDLNTVPLPHANQTDYNVSMPTLPAGKNIDLGTVKGNLWFNSSFMTTLTQNLMLITKIQKEIKLAEAKSTVQSMEMTSELAKNLGELIMSKAEKEAEMHRLLGTVAVVMLAVSVAGLAIQVGGTAASAKAENLEKAKVDAAPGTNSPSTLSAGSSPNVASPEPAPAPRVDTQAPQARPEPVASPQAARPESVTAPASPLQPEPTSSLQAPAETPNQQGVQGAQFHEGQANAVQSDTTRLDNARVARGPEGDQPTTGFQSDERANRAQATDVSSNTESAQRARSNAFSSRDAKPVEGAPETSVKWYNNPEKLKQIGSTTGYIGGWVTQNSAHINEAVSNFIQAGYKEPIANYERLIELVRAAQGINRQAMESSSKGFTDASQIIDSALQLLQKIQDETARAHSMGRQ